MKKILLILILLLNINVYADCYIKVDGVCKLESLEDYVYNENTGSITYDNTNKTITFDNYEGNTVGINNFDSTISIIFNGNNVFNKVEDTDIGIDLYSNNGINIKGNKNSTITFNGLKKGFNIDSNTNYNNLDVIGNNVESLFYQYNSNVLFKDININNSNGKKTIDTSTTYLELDNINISLNNIEEFVHSIITNFKGNKIIGTVDNIIKFINVTHDYSSNYNTFVLNNSDVTCTKVAFEFIYSDNVNDYTMNNNKFNVSSIEGSISYFLELGGNALSTKKQIVTINNNEIVTNKFGYFTKIYSNYISEINDFYLNNNTITVNDTANTAFILRRFNMYAKDNSIKFNNYKYPIEIDAQDGTASVIGGDITIKGERQLVYISNKNNYIIDCDITLESASTDTGNNGLYYDNDNAKVEIKNSNINFDNLYRGIYTKANIVIDKSNFNIDNCVTGLELDTSNISITNSDITIKNTKKGVANRGIYSGEVSHIDFLIENSNILMDFKTRNTSTNNERGFYIKNTDLTIKNSDIIINNLFDGKNTSTSSYIKYGIQGLQSKIILENTYLDIKVDEDLGTAYYNEGSITGDKFTINGDSYKLMTPNTNFYTYNNNQILLNNDDLSNESLVQSNMKKYSTKELLVDKDNYTYEIVSGDKQEVNKNNVDLKSIRIDGNHLLFNELYINDNLFVKDTDYTITKGSTIINFTESGLNKLNNLNTGTYNIKATYTNGEEVLGDFKVVNSINNPKTGDNLIIYILLSFISFLSMITVSKRTRKI